MSYLLLIRLISLMKEFRFFERSSYLLFRWVICWHHFAKWEIKHFLSFGIPNQITILVHPQIRKCAKPGILIFPRFLTSMGCFYFCQALRCIGDLIVSQPKNLDALASKVLGEEPQLEPALNSILRIILRTSSMQEFVAADYVFKCFCEVSVVDFNFPYGCTYVHVHYLDNYILIL